MLHGARRAIRGAPLLQGPRTPPQAHRRDQSPLATWDSAKAARPEGGPRAAGRRRSAPGGTRTALAAAPRRARVRAKPHRASPPARRRQSAPGAAACRVRRRGLGSGLRRRQESRHRSSRSSRLGQRPARLARRPGLRSPRSLASWAPWASTAHPTCAGRLTDRSGPCPWAEAPVEIGRHAVGCLRTSGLRWAALQGAGAIV